MFADGTWPMQLGGKCVVGVQLDGEALVDVEQLHQDAAPRFVCIAKPGLADRLT